MPRPCPYCGDPLTREATNVTVPAGYGHAPAVGRWFYTCETCGREYHGVRVGDRIRLVPISDIDDSAGDVLTAFAWGEHLLEGENRWPH
jgi:hypothetical protein